MPPQRFSHHGHTNPFGPGLGFEPGTPGSGPPDQNFPQPPPPPPPGQSSATAAFTLFGTSSVLVSNPEPTPETILSINTNIIGDSTQEPNPLITSPPQDGYIPSSFDPSSSSIGAPTLSGNDTSIPQADSTPTAQTNLHALPIVAGVLLAFLFLGSAVVFFLVMRRRKLKKNLTSESQNNMMEVQSWREPPTADVADVMLETGRSSITSFTQDGMAIYPSRDYVQSQRSLDETEGSSSPPTIKRQLSVISSMRKFHLPMGYSVE